MTISVFRTEVDCRYFNLLFSVDRGSMMTWWKQLHICSLVSFCRKPVQLEHFILRSLKLAYYRIFIFDFMVMSAVWGRGWICFSTFILHCLALFSSACSVKSFLKCFLFCRDCGMNNSGEFWIAYFVVIHSCCISLLSGPWGVIWLWLLFFLVQDKTFVCCAACGSKMIFVLSLEFGTCCLATLTRSMISLKICYWAILYIWWPWRKVILMANVH